MTRSQAHLTPEERCHIEVLLKRGDSQRSIAKLLQRDPSTIRREIARNRIGSSYQQAVAQTQANTRRSAASRRILKMTPELKATIEDHLKQFQWSPVQLSGWLEATTGTKISHESIYQHIWADKKRGGLLYKNLRHSGKKYNKRRGKNAGRGLIPGRIDIDERPAIVEAKTRIGDWEIDTVIGAQHQGVLVTAVDRASKYTVIELVPNKASETVTQALIKRLGEFPHKVLTITADNGKEFAEHARIAAALNTSMYFAKPYHSWERGLNEHTNGLIRQYLPKGMSFANLTAIEVDKIERLLNNRPRKILGFKTPLEVFSTPPPPGAFHS